MASRQDPLVEDRAADVGNEQVPQLRLDRVLQLLEPEVAEVEDAGELRPRPPTHLGELAAAVGVQTRQLGGGAEVRADAGAGDDESHLLGVGEVVGGLAQPAGERAVQRAAEVEG